MTLLPVNYAEVDLADFTAIYILTKVGNFSLIIMVESITRTSFTRYNAQSHSPSDDRNSRLFCLSGGEFGE